MPNTDAFRGAVTDLIRSEYRQLGGRAQVLIDDNAGTIQVTWSPGAGQPDPFDAAAKLRKGQLQEAVRILEILRFQRPQSVPILYNLGTALSDLGRIDAAVQQLTSALSVDPNHTNSLVALGVALVRQRKRPEAIRALRRAIESEVDNPWAHRNLGACLLDVDGRAEEAEVHLRRAVELLPGDQQSLFGLGQALLALGRDREADARFAEVIDLDDRSPIAQRAKDERRTLAASSFRTSAGGSERLDGVMYCLNALKLFAGMSREEVQKIAFEIAILGQEGLDTNDSAEKYTLRSLAGQFSGLHLVSTMYVAFKILAPDHDVGFDLSREYSAASALHRKASPE